LILQLIILLMQKEATVGMNTSRISGRFRIFRRDVMALFYAVRDPAAPWQAKLVAVLAILYAVSPIDLVPDFIPVMGLLDDIILVPLGMALALRLMPEPVVAAARAKAQRRFATLKHAGAFLLAGIVCMVLVMAIA
jgi:uncharacterized membrane protein YkvA (DUF1232 family)